MNNDTGTSLQGRTALITGGSSGVGRGIALAMADKGAAIAVAGRTLERCERAVAEIEGRGAKAIAIQCDVNDPDDVIRTVDTASYGMGGSIVWCTPPRASTTARSAGWHPRISTSRGGPARWPPYVSCRLHSRRSVESKGLIVNVASGAGMTARRRRWPPTRWPRRQCAR